MSPDTIGWIILGVFFVGCAVAFAALLQNVQTSRAAEALQKWAEGAGYQVLEARRRYLRSGPFFPNLGNQVILRAKLRLREGGVITVWAACGSFMHGMLSANREIEVKFST